MQLGSTLLIGTLALSLFRNGMKGGIGIEQVWGVIFSFVGIVTPSPASHESKTMRKNSPRSRSR